MWQAAQDLIEGNCDESGEWSESFLWEQTKAERAQKRKNNAKWSMNFLKENGIPFTLVNESNYHCIVGDYDFFPSTGLYIHRKTKKEGRGIKNLFRELKKPSYPLS